MIAPRWTDSIRFRLSLFIALMAFTTGSLIVGGVYMWQVSRLDEPELAYRPIVAWRDFETGNVGQLSVNTNAAAQIEYTSYLRALDNLKRGSIGALGVLFVVAFGSSWWVAGLALKPVHRMTTVARDITASDLSRRISLPGPDDELKRLADTFDAMLDRLETGFEDQRRFVQDASHELRNPLAVARTNLDLVLSNPGASPGELQEAAEVARRSTERMSILVEDLLDQARSGVPELAIEDVALAALAADVVDDYRAVARQHRVTIELAAATAVAGAGSAAAAGPIVRGDGPALRRAIGNLVSNAIKASPNGATVTVTVSTPAEGGRARVAVTDNGPGLTDDEQEWAFERFWRGETSSGGAGLGLSIVRHVVERHGGDVAVASEPELGSTFSIELPTKVSGPQRPRPAGGP